MLLGKLDGLGKMAWLAITFLAFAIAWPLGIAMLAYLAGSGRFQAWYAEHADAPGAWFGRICSSPDFGSRPRGGTFHTASSGNRVCNGCRDEALSRLEEERRESRAYLERLREARDKAEFDTLIAERRQPSLRAATPGPADMPA
jgi:hypothetical protein